MKFLFYPTMLAFSYQSFGDRPGKISGVINDAAQKPVKQTVEPWFRKHRRW